LGRFTIIDVVQLGVIGTFGGYFIDRGSESFMISRELVEWFRGMKFLELKNAQRLITMEHLHFR